MKRLTRFAIPALNLLAIIAVCAKLIWTPVCVWTDPEAWRFRPLVMTGNWERGWPWTFSRVQVSFLSPAPGVVGAGPGVPLGPGSNPILSKATLGPTTNFDVQEFSIGLLIADLSLAFLVVALVCTFLYFRMRRTKPWNFSLRSLLVVMLLIAACCGWWFHQHDLFLRERDAVTTLNFRNGIPVKDVTPDWLRRLTSAQLSLPSGLRSRSSYEQWLLEELVIFYRHDEVTFPEGPTSHDQLLTWTRVLPTFHELRVLSFPTKNSILDAELLAPVAECTSLEVLRLWYSNVDDRGIAAIETLPHLKELNLYDCSQVTDAAANSLVKLQTLETVWLVGTSISDAGARRLLALPNLKLASLPAGMSAETIRMLERQGVKVEQPGE